MGRCFPKADSQCWRKEGEQSHVCSREWWNYRRNVEYGSDVGAWPPQTRWCPWSMLWPEATWMSIVCAPPGGHADVRGPCYHWRPWLLFSVCAAARGHVSFLYPKMSLVSLLVPSNSLNVFFDSLILDDFFLDLSLFFLTLCLYFSSTDYITRQVRQYRNSTVVTFCFSSEWL